MTVVPARMSTRPSIRMILSLSVVLAVVLTVTCDAFGHPFHVSIAEAEWNRKTSSLEVSLRVNPVDLEAVLRRDSKNQLRLKVGDPKAERAVLEYLNRVFAVYDADKQRLRAKWVGMEMEVRRGWLYFEFPMKRIPQSLRVDHRLFLDLQQDQVNTVIFKIGGRKKTLHFTRHKSRREVLFDAVKPTSPSGASILK